VVSEETKPDAERVGIYWRDGVMREVPAVYRTADFAVTADQGETDLETGGLIGRPGWVVTHIPTGRQISKSGITEAAARACADDLQVLAFEWSTLTVEGWRQLNDDRVWVIAEALAVVLRHDQRELAIPVPPPARRVDKGF